jgi:thiol:disulfide interchange protein DsbG
MWPGKRLRAGAVARLGVGCLLALLGGGGVAGGALAASGERGEQVWQRLASAPWIALGAEEPERIVYAFTDPNCPYCHLLWRASKPYYSEGLQVRHILVGFLKPSSPGKAAAILGADDPAAALRRHEASHATGGIEPADDPADKLTDRLARNRQLMGRLGIRATPGLVFRTADGKVRKLMGMPKVSKIHRIFRLPKQPQSHPALEPYK